MHPDSYTDPFGDYDAGQQRGARPVSGSGSGSRFPASGSGPVATRPDRGASVRPIVPRDDRDAEGFGARPVRPHKPTVVSPRSFDDAQQVADLYRSAVPVIMNLQAIDKDLQRRLVDFAAGLCYGLGGTLEGASDKVYLLTPADADVSEEERRAMRKRGVNQ